MLLVVVGLLVNGAGLVLIQQRPAEKPRGGLWEFPGGKVEHGEKMRDALKREWKEELGLDVSVGDIIDEAVAHFDDVGTVLLPLFEVHNQKSNPLHPNMGQKVKLVSLDSAFSYPGVPTMALYEDAVRIHCASY